MEHEDELENARRSVVMLSTGAWALRREAALDLFDELLAVRARLRELEAKSRG